MRVLVHKFWGIAASLALSTSVVHAQDATSEGPGRLEIGPIVGAHFFADDLELGVADLPDDSTSPEPLALFGIRVGFAASTWITIEGEADFIPTSDRFYGSNVIAIGARAHVLGYLMKPSKVRPFLVVGAGMMAIIGDGPTPDTVSDDADFAPHWGAGIRIDLGKSLGLRLDGRHILLPDTTDNGLTSDFELQVGLALSFGGSTVTTRTIIMEGEDVVVAAKDSDNDFLTDDRDGCPMEAEDVDNYKDEDGCPEPDNDSDGIADGDDKCPLEAENKNDVDDDDGCPEVDGDGDGLIGSRDQCPDQAEDKDGNLDEDGCPDLDDDGDGVADAGDQCPKKAETKNGWEDTDGCPDELPKAVKKYTGVMTGITFKQGSADIEKKSFNLLDRAAKVLTEYPALKIEIIGHTSDEGDRDFNLALSLQRAESVKKYLVEIGGVPAEQITTIGKGPDDPIAQGKSRKARAKNRRIEFKLVTQ